MEIIRWRQTERGKRNGSGWMVRASKNEALALISSLSMQILRAAPDGERTEFHTDKGEYFSIAVIPDKIEARSHELFRAVEEYLTADALVDKLSARHDPESYARHLAFHKGKLEGMVRDLRGGKSDGNDEDEDRGGEE